MAHKMINPAVARGEREGRRRCNWLDRVHHEESAARGNDGGRSPVSGPGGEGELKVLT
jgi:hypothetical protein